MFRLDWAFGRTMLLNRIWSLPAVGNNDKEKLIR